MVKLVRSDFYSVCTPTETRAAVNTELERAAATLQVSDEAHQ